MSNTTEPPVFVPPQIPIPTPVDRSYQADVIACCIIATVIGTIFIGLRFYTRRVLLNVLGWEDWFLLLAQIFSILTCAFQVREAVLGLGLHWWMVKPENIVPMAKMGWFTIAAYQLSLAFAQVSIVLLYIRIWSYGYARIAAYVLLVLIILYDIFDVVIVFTACIPLQTFWDFKTRGYCHPDSYWWAITWMHIIFDFMIFGLPIPIIFKMTCPKRQKTLLYILFAIGFFASFISIIRYVWLLKNKGAVDAPFAYVPIATWTSIETNTVVVVACLMTLKPLLSRFFPNMLGSYQNQDSGETPDGHIVTIGSRRSRAVLGGHHSRRLFKGREPAVHEVGDLEEQMAEHDRHSISLPTGTNAASGADEIPESVTTSEVTSTGKDESLYSSGDVVNVRKD